MTKATPVKKVVNVKPQQQEPETAPANNYIGTRFVYEGRTFQIWKYTQAIGNKPAEYDAVALLDPSRGIETVPYTVVTRSNNGQLEQVPLHRLENVDVNTHVAIPAHLVEFILADLSRLWLYADKPAKPKNKKVITVVPKKLQQA